MPNLSKFKVPAQRAVIRPVKLTRGIKADVYVVPSASEPNLARFVAIFGKRAVCSCPAATRQNPTLCKHIRSVIFWRYIKAVKERHSRRVAKR